MLTDVHTFYDRMNHTEVSWAFQSLRMTFKAMITMLTSIYHMGLNINAVFGNSVTLFQVTAAHPYQGV